MTERQVRFYMSRGGGQVVSVLAIYSGDPRLNPAEAHIFSVKKCVWMELNEQSTSLMYSKNLFSK